jgi:flagellar export protein FliJ
MLSIARHREQEQEVAVALAMRALDAAAAERDRARERFEQQRHLGEAMHPDELRRAVHLIELRREALLLSEAAVMQADEQLVGARQDWLAAARQRKTYEKLDERDRDAAAQLEAKADQRNLDDLVNRDRKDD